MAKLTSSQMAPEWSSYLTADLPLASRRLIAPDSIQADLRRFSNQCLSVVWRRLSKDTREWLKEWWQS